MSCNRVIERLKETMLTLTLSHPPLEHHAKVRQIGTEVRPSHCPGGSQERIYSFMDSGVRVRKQERVKVIKYGGLRAGKVSSTFPLSALPVDFTRRYQIKRPTVERTWVKSTCMCTGKSTGGPGGLACNPPPDTPTLAVLQISCGTHSFPPWHLSGKAFVIVCGQAKKTIVNF